MANPPHIRKVGAQSNQETRPCDSSSLGPTVAPVSQTPPTGRKRKHRTLSPDQQDSQNLQSNHPSKRRRTLGSAFDRAQRSFWDSLSRLWLAPDALRELNRRNALLAATPPQPDRKPEYQVLPRSIEAFARHGGPDLSDIRQVWKVAFNQASLTFEQYSDRLEKSTLAEAMPSKGGRKSSGRTSSDQSSTTRRSSAYTPHFAQKLIDEGFYPVQSNPRAANHEGWSLALVQPRPSLSPSRMSDGEYHRFMRAVDGAKNEDEVMARVVPKIIGEDRYPSRQNSRLTNLDRLVDGIVMPQPDYYEGTAPRRGNRQLRRLLDTSIVPSSHRDDPFLPNISLEAKGPTGSLGVAELQSCHDGALFARGAHRVENLGREEDVYDNDARTVSAVYHGAGHLDFHTHHLSQPDGPGTPSRTHMTRLGSFALGNSPQSFRQGVGAWRNASDLAHSHRERLIDDAHRRAQIITPEPSRVRSRSTRRRPLSSHAPIVRKPLACQTAGFDSNDGYANSSSEDEDSDDGDRSRPIRRRGKTLTSKPDIQTIAPKRPATSPSVGRRSTLRRRTRTSGYLDPDNSDEESSRGRGAANILLASPGRPATRSPSISRRRLSSER